jgi:hypothetical protein
MDVSQMSQKQIKWQLFLTSFALLFFELICIRLIPAYVRYLGYFMNFVMLSAFLGIGLGIMVVRREKLILPRFSVWLFLLLSVVSLARFELRLPSTQVLYFAAGDTYAQPENGIVLPIIITIVTVAFMILARPLGKLLTALPPLQAYSLDIAGSLAGIAAFFIISYLSLPPIVWFLILMIILLFNAPKKDIFNNLIFWVGIFLIIFKTSTDSIWSPYYRIQVSPDDNGGFIINVNNIGHQEAINYLKKETFYFRVYDLFPKKTFRKVLILGAGSGSDVSIALHNGVEQVDAVEIDPVIYKIGQELNPDRPYADPRVQIHIDDGRSYLRNTKEKYDLIIFALPDSLTLTSSYSSLRLESFLLTTDALKNARNLLNDDGLVVLYNYYRQEWLVRKLASMAEDAFGMSPFVTTYGAFGRSAVIISGPGLNSLPQAWDKPYSEDVADVPVGRGFQLPLIGFGRMSGDPTQALATDDWPFVYMPVPTIPNLYIVALIVLLIIAFLLVFIAVPRPVLQRFDWHFFFLGVAFMLLESRSLVTFALLFGSTWMINSLVFFAILSSVLLAVLFNAKFQVKNLWILYTILFVLLVLNYFISLDNFLNISSIPLRYSLASLLAFAPIFTANIVFSHAFRDSFSADIAFASNLLGSVIGGILEYLALAFGYQSLILVVIFFYLLAFVTRQRAERAFAK